VRIDTSVVFCRAIGQKRREGSITCSSRPSSSTLIVALRAL
jgi:hypothetical protein